MAFIIIIIINWMNKRILFDFISLQGYHNGGEEYTRAILSKLSENSKVDIVGLFDSTLPFLDKDESKFRSRYTLVDIMSYNSDIAQIIADYDIDTFFIGIGQRYSKYDLLGINCKTIIVIHDIGDIECTQNNIQYLFPKSVKNLIKIIWDYCLCKTRHSIPNEIMCTYSRLRKFIANPDVRLITVSNYTANSLKYYFPELCDKEINVLYPPKKKYEIKEFPDDVLIKDILKKKIAYALLLNINRANKNSKVVFDVFHRIRKEFPDLYLVVTGAEHSEVRENTVYLSYVSNNDMEILYKNAWVLIYPSFTEGFGYPPIESMKYGTPVLSANVCSMPEILGDSAIFFSPFYQNELFTRMLELRASYIFFTDKSRIRSSSIQKKQDEDTRILIDLISN